MAEPRGTRNFFELFGFPESFDINASDLTARYRDLARQFHPDRFAQSPPAERRLAIDMTATLNEAVHTLRDPVARARYLLGLKGIDTGEETDTSMSPAFLMTQMELREQFAEVRDASGPPDRFDAVRAHAESACRERISTLQRSFATGDAASLQAARNAVRELQFLRKVLADIDALAEDR